VSINGFSFKHVDYLERVFLNLPPSPLDNSLELKRLMSESVIPNMYYNEIPLLHPALNRIENEALYETMEVVQTILENPEL
jgi:hypothetical protein